MAPAEPPGRPPGRPRRAALAAGTLLFRVYHLRHGLGAFKRSMSPATGSTQPGGGRFDGTVDQPYPFLYAGSTPGVAVAESLLRDAAFSDSGTRTVLRSLVAHLGCGALEVTRSLELVDLRGGRALAAIGATAALVHCAERSYPVTRRWAHRLREWAPDAAGLVWRSRWEPDGDAYVLFGDRLDPEADLRALSGQTRRTFDGERGLRWLQARLLEYHTDLRAG